MGRMSEIKGFDLEKRVHRFEGWDITLEDGLTTWTVLSIEDIDRDGRGLS